MSAQAPAMPALDDQTLEERIRNRAYEIFLNRGDRPGSPEEDWLLAEAEIHDHAHPGKKPAPKPKD